MLHDHRAQTDRSNGRLPGLAKCTPLSYALHLYEDNSSFLRLKEIREWDDIWSWWHIEFKYGD
jgi:hypothetical protein